MDCTVGRSTRVLRTAQGIPQGELAKLTGIEAYRLCMIERGHLHPRPAEVRALAAVLLPAVGAARI
jgi:predicted transcriptional regulator